MLNLAAADTLSGVAGTTTAITYSIYGMEYASSVETFKRLAQGQLPTSVGTLYTVPSSTQTFVKEMRFANATGSAVAGVIIYNGGTAAANQITQSLTIPANGLLIINDNGMEVTDASGNLQASGANSFGTALGADTTPLADGTAGTATLAARADHTHQSPGAIAAITGSVAIANTETQVVGATLPTSWLAAGTTFRITAAGVQTTATSGAAGTFRIRIGNASLSGNIATSAAATSAVVSAQGFYVEALVTCRSTSAIIGEMMVWGSTAFTAANVPSVTVATVAITLAQTNVIELTYISGTANTTATFHVASIEVVKM